MKNKLNPFPIVGPYAGIYSHGVEVSNSNQTVNDPFSDLGRLKAELFRAARLVVDTGLHKKKWSREKAIKYLIDTTGVDAATAQTEIERYMVWPAQALGCKIGMINFLQLRSTTKRMLNKRIHNWIVEKGLK